MAKQIAALAAATLLALAGVFAFVYLSGSAQHDHLVMVVGFLAPTIAALLAIARVNELNGEVRSLKRNVNEAAVRTEKAAVKADQAAELVDEATKRVERSR